MSQRWGPPPGRRPPWWPEGEPFPPDQWRRRGGPPAFLWRLGCAAFLLLALAAASGAVLAAVVMNFGGPAAGPWNVRPERGFPGFPVFLLVILVIAAAIAFRGFRRMSRPLNSLIDAARRIETGDYSATVPEWGSQDIRSVARAFNSMSARLKSIDEQRRGFLADVTHELRTPLSVIRGQAEAIADGLYPGDAAHLGPILDATETLDRLVEDLRTLVLTDAGNLVLNKEPTDLGALVHDAVESFQRQAEAAGISLTADVADGLPAVEVDPARIRQVIGNLLSNAIRHTPSGGSVKVAGGSSGEQVTITVTDSGEGIPTELLPHIFERFVKGPNSTGSGLGLAIAYEIVTAHGGRLEVESAAEAGTTARVALPRDHI